MMKRVVVFFCLFFMCICPVFGASKFKVKLEKCVDGDTAKFIIDNEVKTVRFLSIDTPEIKHGANDAEAYGEEAKEYTCNALKSAKSIKLQYDPKSDKTDKYDRILAWVFVDDELLQEKLIREGLAEIKYVKGDYLYTDNLKSLQMSAEASHKGIWSVVDSVSENVTDSGIISNKELFIAVISIVAIVLVCIFGKSSSSKKKAIKSIRKISGI